MAGATVRRSPYKDFLQPALQRRFATASLCVLAIAYAQALVLANWSSRPSESCPPIIHHELTNPPSKKQ